MIREQLQGAREQLIVRCQNLHFISLFDKTPKCYQGLGTAHKLAYHPILEEAIKNIKFGGRQTMDSADCLQ